MWYSKDTEAGEVTSVWEPTKVFRKEVTQGACLEGWVRCSGQRAQRRQGRVRVPDKAPRATCTLLGRTGENEAHCVTPAPSRGMCTS